MEIELIYLITFILVTLQTIVGVGVLVLGTPIFLLFNYNIVEIMNLLLPISITTSLLNYIYLKSNKSKLNINLDKEIKKNFIIIFLPGIFLGLFLTSKLINYINFEILVSIVIFASLFVKWNFNNKINSLPVKFKKSICHRHSKDIYLFTTHPSEDSAREVPASAQYFAAPPIDSRFADFDTVKSSPEPRARHSR